MLRPDMNKHCVAQCLFILVSVLPLTIGQRQLHSNRVRLPVRAASFR